MIFLGVLDVLGKDESDETEEEEDEAASDEEDYDPDDLERDPDWDPELGEEAAILEFDQRMDDRLRMDQDRDPVGVDAE